VSVLTPDLSVISTIEATETYKLSDTDIKGRIDGLEALKQAIYKVLSTERYEHPIYSFSYGIQIEDLIGKDMPYVKIELKRRLSECLLQDDRIVTVDNFKYISSGDNLTCEFDIKSIYGNATITKEVSV
jgi:hypothetical protein